MRMLIASIDLQLGNDATAETVLREHLLHGDLDHPLRVLLVHLPEAGGTLPARISRVANVLLLLRALGRKLDLVRVDDDDEIAAIDVRCEEWLVLAAENRSHLRGE